MKVYQIDPIEDPRWGKLIEKHPKASVFHTTGWLAALRETYGYKPLAFTTSPPGSEMDCGFVVCGINSWLTGRRLVSLPFSDHCNPLFESPSQLYAIVNHMQGVLKSQSWKYLELRPISDGFHRECNACAFVPIANYFLHTVDLRPETDRILKSFHRDSVQRRIRHAHRVNLCESHGNSLELLKSFYGLFVITRKRQRLPPIPFSWFCSLTHYLGEALDIRVAYYQKKAVAAILNLRFRNVVYYKYGCSDARFNHLGAMPWLLWRAMQDAKANHATQFDMGRTEESNLGLLRFKNHFTDHSERLIYWSFPESRKFDLPAGWKLKAAQRVFTILPNSILSWTGRILYRHIG